MKIIDGNSIAETIYRELREKIATLSQHRVIPGLGIILVGDNPASQVYVAKKEEIARSLGLVCKTVVLTGNTSEDEVVNRISELNNDNAIHGIIIQLPLPAHLNADNILSVIAEGKDIDALRTNSKKDSPTVEAVIRCIENTGTTLSGLNSVVVGKGFFGRLIFDRLRREGADVVSVDRGNDIASVLGGADVIISAVGVPGLITGEMVKAGAVVVDVGITRVGGKVLGDVDFSSVSKQASWITPVPGGVGPVTVACLMEAVISAAALTAGVIFD